jgi:hypothetical protein
MGDPIEESGIFGEVVAEIKKERDYQIEKWGIEFDDKNTATNWIAFITSYAGKGYKFEFSEKEFHDAMVKTATLAIAALEAQKRNGKMPPDHWQK